MGDDVALAEAAGLDGLIVSETAVPSREVLPQLVLDRVQGRSLRLALGVEPQEGDKYPSREAAADRLRRAVEFAHAYPQWLRLDTRPVFVFWNLPVVPTASGERPQDAWAWIRGQADPDHTTVWIAEGGDTAPGTGTMTYLAGDAFDGLHLYSIAWADDPARQLGNWATRLRATGPNRVWAATVMPGGLWGAGPNASSLQSRDRQEGAFYRRTWEGAMATNPEMVVITSWNEFPEQTAIRPHPSDPTFGYGTAYVELTRELVAVAKARGAAR